MDVSANPYTPKPIDVSGVELPQELDDLVDLLAENNHDTWAQQRISQGWTFGPKRNDKLKQHPDLVAYGALTEEEKQYDISTAIGAIKSLYVLGYKVVKA